jgi:hypothetical protein
MYKMSLDFSGLNKNLVNAIDSGYILVIVFDGTHVDKEGRKLEYEFSD